MATSSTGVRVGSLDLWSVVQALYILLTGTIAWFGKKALARLDHLENQAVLKEAFDKAIAEMKADRRLMHEENLDVLKRIETKIDVGAQATLLERVNTLERDLRKATAYAEAIKHEHLDPYAREVAILRTRIDQLDRRGHG